MATIQLNITVVHKNGTGVYEISAGSVTFQELLGLVQTGGSGLKHINKISGNGGTGDEIGFSLTEGGDAVDLSASIDITVGGNDTTIYALYPEPQAETITGFYLDGTEYKIGGDEAAWGNISGTLSDQTDLQAALDAKVGSSNNTINNVVHLSQADYDALQNPDSNTWYSTPDNGSGGFDPENAGSVGQVVKKTSTGYGWGNVDSISTTQPTNPAAGSAYFDTTSLTIKVYDGTQWKEVGSEGGGSGTPISDPGIYWNKEDGLISVSSDGTTWMTIADKNLGATEVFTKQDISNGKVAYLDRQLGFIYQWGRNFPFSWNSIICQDAQVSYNSNKPGIFIAYKGDWLSSSNNNLRGAVTNTNVARKGPCDIGWHVPSRADMTQLDTILQAIGRDGIYSDPFSGETNDGGILKFTPAPMIEVTSNGEITYTSAKSGGWWPYNSNNYIQFWLSDYNDTYGYLYSDDDDSEGDPAGNYSKNRSTGAPIRPFKNEGVQPTTTWEVLYQPS